MNSDINKPVKNVLGDTGHQCPDDLTTEFPYEESGIAKLENLLRQEKTEPQEGKHSADSGKKPHSRIAKAWSLAWRFIVAAGAIFTFFQLIMFIITAIRQ